MATRAYRYRGFGLQVDVPDRVARLVRRRHRPVQPSPPGALALATPPPLRIRKREAAEAVRFFWNPEHDPVATSMDPAAHRLPLDVARRLAGSDEEAEQIAAVTWYHTIELPGGVFTPGEWDHRELVPSYGLPADLSGAQALDIATNNGFWAFELERRGATVSAVDIDWISELDLPQGVREYIAKTGIDIPIGEGFDVAHRLLGSKVKQLSTDIYELDPNRHGVYDLVHIADVLVHLHDPLRALQRVRAVTSGTAYIVDAFDPELPSGQLRYRGGWDGSVWWDFSADVLAQLVLDAGFASVRALGTYNLSRTFGAGAWRVILVAET